MKVLNEFALNKFQEENHFQLTCMYAAASYNFSFPNCSLTTEDIIDFSPQQQQQHISSFNGVTNCISFTVPCYVINFFWKSKNLFNSFLALSTRIPLKLNFFWVPSASFVDSLTLILRCCMLLMMMMMTMMCERELLGESFK